MTKSLRVMVAIVIGLSIWGVAGNVLSEDRNKTELILSDRPISNNVSATNSDELAHTLADANEWQVEEASGDTSVKITFENIWKPLTPGTVLGPKSSIRTGPTGWALLTHGNDRMVIAAKTEMAIPENANSPSTITPSRTKAGNITRIVQTIGSILFKVNKSPDRAFEVETPYLLVGVKGTTFGVSVGNDSANVSVSDGTVGVSSANGSSSADVSEGQTASVSSAPGSGVSVGQSSRGGGRSGNLGQSGSRDQSGKG